MQSLAAEQQDAMRANLGAIQETVGGRGIEPGEGARIASERLNAMRDAANKGVKEAYDAARAAGGDAMLPRATETREAMLEAVRDYDLESVPRIAKEIEKFGEGGAPTVRDLLDARQRLSVLRQSSDTIESGAASKAIAGMDKYVADALDNDLFLGDPNAVKAWRDALKARREFGKTFEGNDLVQALTAREPRSGEMALKTAPEDAANLILGKSDLGWIGKKDLKRDLTRLRDVLGAESPEWAGIRGELFGRLMSAAKGPSEGGVTTVSGTNFLNAWDKAKLRDPEIIRSMFTPAERKMIDDFAEISARVSKPVKGGDNPSNSAISFMVMKTLNNLGTAIGGAAGSIFGPAGAGAGAAVGRGVDEFLASIRGVQAAIKATKGLPKGAQGLSQAQIEALLKAGGDDKAIAAALTGGRGSGAVAGYLAGNPKP
jgi:hypothetical protein